MPLLTDIDEIIEAMNKELEDAPESTIHWLVEQFNVPIRSSNFSETVHKIIKVSKLKIILNLLLIFNDSCI